MARFPCYTNVHQRGFRYVEETHTEDCFGELDMWVDERLAEVGCGLGKVMSGCVLPLMYADSEAVSS